MTKFIPGLLLSELFYKEVIKNLIEEGFPGLKYSAALIGSGSEVFGFDTERSTDHHWGPRVLIFLSPKDFGKRKVLINYLSKTIPPTFRGFSTHFGKPDEIGVQLLVHAKAGQPINHRVEFFTIESFFKNYLQINPFNDLSVLDWLTLSEQKLRSISSGKIWHDQLGLKGIQNKFTYFPKDVWLYLLASEWSKISQEEPFVGRCGEVGDELGSRLIAARLVQSIMRICFLMEKEYAPYSKWFGTAFLKLKCSKAISPILNKVLLAKDWKYREKYLTRAYSIIAKMHNNLKITKPLSTSVSNFHGRPYMVIHGDRFVNEFKKIIKDTRIKRISNNIGSVNQFSSSVDLLENDKLIRKLKILYV